MAIGHFAIEIPRSYGVGYGSIRACEKTRDLYRFAVAVKPGEPATLLVEEQRTDVQYIALTNMDDQSIRIYLAAPVVGEKVNAALAEVGNSS